MSKYFAHFSHAVSNAVGKPIAFILALVVVCSWAMAGPVFGYSQIWQLLINTGTTIVTFLMIFVLQNSQNRDGQALQAKLDELILTNKNAENRFIGIERLDEAELLKLRRLIDEKCHADDDCAEEIADEWRTLDLGRREPPE
jgi:low affinity Fe/Cu permease